MASLGRPRGFDREAALEAAMMLFWRKGFAGASMNDLCEAMGIRSPSLYAAFQSKEALYIEAVEEYVRIFAPRVWGRLAEAPTARAGFEDFLLAAAESMAKTSVKPGGCMATLTALGDECPVAVTSVVTGIRQQMLSMLQSRLESALAAGELAASTDLNSLGRFFLSTYQGMAVQARDGATRAQLKDIAKTAMMAWPDRHA
jgi:AcrR family transcriptional regulator